MISCYARERHVATIAAQFRTEDQPPSATPSWSVSPGHDALVVRCHPRTGSRHLGLLRWGLELTARGARPPANVRAEAVDDADDADELTYLARHCRCLVPADAFYLWHELPSGKHRFAAGRGDRATMALAGLWKSARDWNGLPRRTFAVLTTPASGVLNVLQDRMPVVLNEAEWPLWLGEAEGNFLSVLERQAGPSLHAWQVSRTRPDLRAKEAWKAAGQRRPLLKAGVPWYSRLLEQPARTEPTHDEYDIAEVLYPVYEVKTGDPFIGCAIAGWEIAWSRGRLDALIGRFDETVLGRGDTQQKQAFRRTAEVLADRLAEAERLCAQLGLQNAPSHIDPSPLDDCFGLDQDLARLGRDLVELAQIVRVWPYHADEQLPWPDPDTMSTLVQQQDFVVYQGVWHKQRKYGGPAHTDLAEVGGRLWQRRLRGSIDLITWAEALARAAEAIVAGLEVTASVAPEELGRALPAYDPAPAGFVKPTDDPTPARNASDR